MNKYIDAEKLIAEIERRKMPFKKDIEDGIYPTYLCALMDFEEIITSLHKEQPKEICSKCIHHGKDDDYCYNPYGGMQSSINENGVYECTGFYEKEQERPDVDLEKEIQEHLKECLDVKFPTTDIELIKKDVAYTARKFYELGKTSLK